MDLFSLIVVLVIVGLVMWAINSFIPMQPQIKQILNVAVVIILVLWLLSLLIGGFPNIHIGR